MKLKVSGSYMKLTGVMKPVWASLAVLKKVEENRCACWNHKLVPHNTRFFPPETY